jgi:hypothetical protein
MKEVALATIATGCLSFFALLSAAAVANCQKWAKKRGQNAQ